MSKAKIVLVSLVWLFVLTVGVIAYRYIIVPKAEEIAATEVDERVDESSDDSIYKHRLNFGIDGFSGYAVLRSAEMAQQLRSRAIRLDFKDDGASYAERLAGLKSGKLQLAVFPIDALLKASQQENGPVPATIVTIIDETKGADAVVAYKAKYPNVDALNKTNTKFVLVGDSPSETLVRLLMNKFQLDLLNDRSMESVGGADEVFARYKGATPSTDEVYVTWEPVVSELLENEQMAVLFDSGDQSGYIVDTLVVNRDFLIKHRPVVQDVVESYLRTLYAFNSQDKLKQLVQRDAQIGGSSLTDEQAGRLAAGIEWKNTQENLAHFGLRSASVVHIEDMVDRIKRVLLETGGLSRDPTGGDSASIFTSRILRDLQAEGFHPGTSQESVREEVQLASLSEGQWESLVPVGKVDVPPLVYARSRASLTQASKVKLDSLIETLESFPTYYLMVRGNASSRGDAEANRKLAQQRAEAAVEYLLENDVPRARVKVTDGEITGQTTVTFVLGELPY